MSQNLMTDSDMEKQVTGYFNFIRKDQSAQIIAKMNPQFVACSVAEKSLTLGFDVADWELNPGKVMHGGLITTAFDTTLGTICRYFGNSHFVTTTNIAVNFLEPVFPNDRLLITAKINRTGRTLAFLSAEARSASDDRLCDTATATFMYLKEVFVLPEWAYD